MCYLNEILHLDKSCVVWQRAASVAHLAWLYQWRPCPIKSFSNQYSNLIGAFCTVLQKTLDPGTLNKMFTRSGYLFLMEKKALGTTSWSKCYCHYRREGRVFCMIPYNQVNFRLLNYQQTRRLRRIVSSSAQKGMGFTLIHVWDYFQMFKCNSLSNGMKIIMIFKGLP